MTFKTLGGLLKHLLVEQLKWQEFYNYCQRLFDLDLHFVCQRLDCMLEINCIDFYNTTTNNSTPY